MANASAESLVSTAPAASTHAAPIARASRRWSYIGTGAVAALSIAAAIVGDALLARAWPRGDFLLYNGVNRFLSLLVGLVCLQLGFGLVKECRNASPAEGTRVLANAIYVSGAVWFVSTLLMLAFAGSLAEFLHLDAFADRRVVAMISVWLLGHTLLHVVVSWLRACGEVSASNQLAFVCRVVAVLGIATGFLLIPAEVSSYYGWLGAVVGAACLVAALHYGRQQAMGSSDDGWLGSRLCEPPAHAVRHPTGNSLRSKPSTPPSAGSPVAFDFALCRRLVSYSWSRCADGLLRQASLVALTTTLFALGRGETAGELGILQMLIRGIESLFQPLVLLVLADSFAHTSPEASRRDAQRMWTAVVLFSVSATVGLMVVGEWFLACWLGPEYRDLAGAFRMTALSVLPTIGTILLRGHLDSRWSISPLAWINGVAIVVTSAAAWWMDRSGLGSLMALSMMVVVVQWIQFAVQFVLLRTACGLRLWDRATLDEIIGRLRSAMRKRRDLLPGEGADA
ncbi:MAG: hypothetical protein IT428_32160 [Planctomycetaceae bacterium]|nr:hypothetical protein [Planctomycetaceae bacterium]